MLKIEWLSFVKDAPARGMWDQTFLADTLDSLKKYKSDRNICIIPGASHYEKYDEINEYISKYDKVLVIITSDECSLFNTDCLEHKDMIVYSQYPTDEKSSNVDFWIPIAYSAHIRKTLKNHGLPDKDLDWFFSGQITHRTREELADKLDTMDGRGILVRTEGFTQGLTPKKYGAYMAQARVVPSPAGVVKPEAFRTYEALEAGAVPIPQGREYHMKMLEDSVFVYLDEWDGLDGYVDNYNQRYPYVNNVAQSWWLQQKRNIRQRFIKDLDIKQKHITFLMSTSPIPTNPSTEVIEKSIASIKKQLPDAEILIMADGVRPEQKHLEANYQEYLRRLLWKCNLEWENVTCIVYEEHYHQLEMTRKTLEKVTTDLTGFLEHDQLFHDKYIDWKRITKLLLTSKLDVMRFYFDRILEPAHAYLMLETDPIEIGGVPLVRTGQWSQRPHVAKTDKYKQVLRTYASEHANCMIEDAIHGAIANNFVEKGKAGWNDNKIAIYTPDDDYSFAYHIDGRGEESKYEEKQTF